MQFLLILSKKMGSSRKLGEIIETDLKQENTWQRQHQMISAGRVVEQKVEPQDQRPGLSVSNGSYLQDIYAKNSNC